MAFLQKDELKVEIKFVDISYGWIAYNFRFFCSSLPVFNPALHDKDYFFANEDEDETLIPIFERALQNEIPIEWEPVEPDLRIEINQFRTNGVLSSDYFDLTFLIDVVQLSSTKEKAYGNKGLAFQISVTRKQLEDFVKELKREYEEFIVKQKEKIGAVQRARIERKLKKAKVRNSE